VAGFAQTAPEAGQPGGVGLRRPEVQISNHRHRRLLRARRERQRRRAAKQRDELATLHSITSSAVASKDDGMAMSSNRAGWWLMTSSNLLDCITGRSTGFPPLRMRPV